MNKILVTGATGQLGHLVIDALLRSLPASRIVAAARDLKKAEDLSALGIDVREADYDIPETLRGLFEGVEKSLLISSSEIGKRVDQHRAVIEAAKQAGVKLFAYTSVLHAYRSTLGLAEEHRQTEEAIRASGLPSVLLRNGWYTENYTAAIPIALEQGAIQGCAGEGRISSASRRDYADAAAAVLTSGENFGGKIYELSGDGSYTLAELAEEISRQSGKRVVYNDLPEADYRSLLVGAGFPEPVAEMLAQSETAASEGALYNTGDDLSRLIGRPTTPLSEPVASVLSA